MNHLLREWLCTVAAFSVLVAVLSIGAGIKSWLEYRKENRK